MARRRLGSLRLSESLLGRRQLTGIGGVAGVDGTSELEVEHVNLAERTRPMLNPRGHDEKLSAGQFDGLVGEIEEHLALEDEEKVVAVIVLVPYEVAGELRDLDFAVLKVADDPRPPRLVEGGERFTEVDWFHDAPRSGWSSTHFSPPNSKRGGRASVPLRTTALVGPIGLPV